MKTKLFILLIAIIALPGVYIQGELIHFTDILIPILFVYYTLKGRTIKIHKYVISLALYVIVCLLSISFATLSSGKLYIEAFLKWMRLFNILLLFSVMAAMIDSIKNKEDAVLGAVINCGIISGLIGIFLFFAQSALYRPPQTFLFFGRVFYRAGGVFAEPLTFSFMMGLVFSVALRCILNKNHTLSAGIAIIISCISIACAQCRTGVVVIAAIMIRAFFSKKILSRNNIILLLVFFTVIIGIASNNSFISNFFNSRIGETIERILSFDYKTIDSALSGRLSVWQGKMRDFSDSTFIQYLFGRGYKIDAISDNNFISALYYTGFAGLITFIAYIFTLIKTAFKCSRIQRSSISVAIYQDAVIAALICMIFSDAMTMSRPMYLVTFFSVISIYGKDRKEIQYA